METVMPSSVPALGDPDLLQPCSDAILGHTEAMPVPADGQGHRVLVGWGSQWRGISLDDSPNPYLHALMSLGYLRLFRRFDWMMFIGPFEADVGATLAAAGMPVDTGPGVLLAMRFADGADYSGIGLTVPHARGGWWVVRSLMGPSEEDPLSHALFTGMDGRVSEATILEEIPDVLRRQLDAVVADVVDQRIYM